MHAGTSSVHNCWFFLLYSDIDDQIEGQLLVTGVNVTNKCKERSQKTRLKARLDSTKTKCLYYLLATQLTRSRNSTDSPNQCDFAIKRLMLQFLMKYFFGMKPGI